MGLSHPLHYLLYRERENLRGLTFVQIGANDGRGSDPMHLMVKQFGWKGLCVEPLAAPFEHLKRNYAEFPGVKPVRVAIFEEPGYKTMYTVDASQVKGATGSYPSAYSSFYKEMLYEVEHLVPGVRDKIIEEQVECVPYAKLLADNGITKVDIVQIDAEGYDAEIVKMIDFEKNPPKYLNFEHYNLSPEAITEVQQLLCKHGYSLCMSRTDTAAVKPRMD
jgi:FkbM family methyltransferase